MKGKRTDLADADCAIARALQIVGDWWSLLIVREAVLAKVERFSDFQKRLGLAKNILSTRLKKLVETGIFTIEPATGSNLSHRYVLTPKGEALHVVLVVLWQWGENHCFEPGELKYAMVDTSSGNTLAALSPCAKDGHVLGTQDLDVIQTSPMKPATH